MLTSVVLASLLFNDGSGGYGVGGNMVGIKGSESIRMVSEAVHVKLPECKVSVSFVFHNDGPATTALMIFPENGGFGVVSPSDPEAQKKTHFAYFRSWVDGKPVKVTRQLHDRNIKDGFFYTNWWVKKVAFKAGQTVKVRDDYQGEPGKAGAGGPHTSNFLYVLGTGGSWKGPIGAGTVKVDCKSMVKKYDLKGIVQRNPDSDLDLTLQSGSFVWTFKNLKPVESEGVKIEWTPKGMK